MLLIAVLVFITVSNKDILYKGMFRKLKKASFVKNIFIVLIINSKKNKIQIFKSRWLVLIKLQIILHILTQFPLLAW